jgi:PAS domain S-box-containing protein
MEKKSSKNDDLALEFNELKKQFNDLKERETKLNAELSILKRNNIELERFFKVTLDLLCIADLNGSFKKVNAQWEKTLGYKTEELENKKFLDFVHPDDLESTLNAIKNLASNKDVTNFVNRYRCKDGSYRWIEWRSTPHDELIFAAARDITDRITYEEALKLNESRLRQIIDLVPHFIFAKDRDGRYILGNKCIADSIGCTVEDMIGKTDLELYPQTSEATKFRSDDLDVIQKGEPKIIPLETVTYSDGSFHYLNTVKIPFKLSMTRQDAILGVAIDITEIKKMEDAHRESEEKFKELTDLLPQSIYECDITGRLTFVNQKAFESFGYTQEQFEAGLNVIDIVSPEEQETAHNNFQALLNGHKVPGQEYTAVRKNGSIFPVVVYSSPIIRSGKTIGLRGILFDITEQKKVEESLKKSEDRFRSIIQNSYDVIVIVNSELKITFVSPSAKKILDLSPESLIGKSPLEVVHPDDVNLIKKEIFDAMNNSNYGIPTEFRFHKPDGTWIYLEAVANNLLNYPGIDGLVITCRDITERKRTNNSLSDSERQFRGFLNSTDDLAFLKDDEGKYIFVNYSLANFFGKNEEEILGKTDFSLMPEEAAKYCALSDSEALKSEEVVISEEYVHNNIYETRKFKIFLNENKLAIGGFIRNITEKRKLEKQIIQSEKMAVVGQLAGGIAHDLNNILTALIGNTELLNRKICPQCKNVSVKYIDALMKANTRAKNIILQILTFSKGQPVKKEIFNLNDTIIDMGKMLSRLIPENIKITKSQCQENLTINADISQVEQIIMNLVINSRDAIPGNGEIEIISKTEKIDYDIITKNGILKPGYYALLTIKDNGAGIPSEIIDKIFDPFFTTKESGKGTGLGLAVVLNNINKNDSFVNLYSEISRGTEFRIYFPLIRDEEKFDFMPNQEELLLGNNEVILIVEDDESIRYMLTEYLTELNYSIIIAINGFEALDILNTKKVDIILTDLTMPDMGGIELYKNIKQQNHRIPVIAMSGYYDYKELESNKFDDLLEKPLDMSKVSLTLSKTIKKYS